MVRERFIACNKCGILHVALSENDGGAFRKLQQGYGLEMAAWRSIRHSHSLSYM